jgi:MFS family permease
MNAINVILSMMSGIVGSFFVDSWGRRNLFIWGTFLTGVTYIPINVLASFGKTEITTSMGYAFIACIFLYGIFFSFTWTPLQNLYPAEVLPNRARGKGVAFSGLASSAANFVNLYATPVALKNIGWKTYTIFCGFAPRQSRFQMLTFCPSGAALCGGVAHVPDAS